MGKRQRSDYRGDGGASSTESNDETLLSGKMNGGEVCTHILKSIDLPTIRKQIKTNEQWYRTACSKCGDERDLSVDFLHEPTRDSGGGDPDRSLWLCLKCGSQLCGRKNNRHALQHYATPRSDMHALAMNTTTFDVWCYCCNVPVDAYAKPKLLDIVEYVKREATKVRSATDVIDGQLHITTESVRKMMINVLQSTPTSFDVPDAAKLGGASDQTYDPKPSPGVTGAAVHVETAQPPAHRNTNASVEHPLSMARSVVDALPRVRGLSNLGNTCFFNAVLQCLARTPYLLHILKQSATEAERVHIPGGVLQLAAGGEMEVPPIEGVLDPWRSLTQALTELLTELTANAPGVLSPNRLLQELTCKWPQFDGGDQHDAHELLRHLLESVRTDDLRRYQSLILQRLGLDTRRSQQNVDGNQKALVRFYGEQISQWVFRPEQVFRGSLVSTLTCQECQHTSSQHEYFLDISLPVCVEKPQPPVRRRTSPEPSDALPTNAVARSPSKKDREREKKPKRIAKHHKNHINLSSLGSGAGAGGAGDEGEPMWNMVPVTDHQPFRQDDYDAPAAGADVSSDDSNEPTSDADVEDNDDGGDGGVGSIPRGNGPIVMDQNGNQHPQSRSLPEKLDDTPENPNKEPDGGGNVVCSVGISAQRAAHMARQLSGGNGAVCDNSDERRATNDGRRTRQRTVSHADWSNTVAPRYQCEDGEYSVQSCFNNFTAVELMTGNNKVCCEACTERINGKGGRSVNTNATKQFLISQPPAVLILHLKRFQVSPRGMFKKLNKPVAFPFVLDIAPFCGSKVKRASHIRPGQRQILYALYGLVEHSGSMHGGHYVAYVKVRPMFTVGDERWKFIPQGTKDELDRKSEQEMAKEQALRMGVVHQLRDSDDSLSSSRTTSENDERAGRKDASVGNVDGDAEEEKDSEERDELEGAVGYTPRPVEPTLADVETPPGKWYCVSDSYVREVSEECVLKVQAYMLFYERIF